MEDRQLLVVLGHPRPDSLCAALAEAYAEVARAAGAQVTRMDLGLLRFDPVLRSARAGDQALEPDLHQAQQAILAARHVAWVYPVWWGTMTALLKGFLDRVFVSGFAYRYRSGSALWDRLLQGRSAELLVTMDAPPWYYRWFDRMPGHWQMRRTVLEFCGFKPVRIASYGAVRSAPPQRIERWLADARQRGEQAGRRLVRRA
ncbi:NAD(P)H-dependent oxidoreductase [Rubrivivax rivuli]|uniref:Flavodoxin family protein n=1 Tax=Rubrivivax rivuli TaxID=1862385 RepID=A0A437RB39_9BURK|nr:NAD(P)H-dependent oxidoreductase [Rubrivivax rivuli]RVU43894.1 flavodoxin family protein [Rubrivivax rivuli]